MSIFSSYDRRRLEDLWRHLIDIVGYTDLVVTSGGFKIPASSAPADIVWNGVRAYQFASGDHVYLEGIQLPHGYKRQTDLLFHVHFTNAATIADGETVNWGLNYTVANVHGVYAAPAWVHTSFTNNAAQRAKLPAAALSGTTIVADTHLISGSATIDGSDLLLSAIMMADLEYDPLTDSTWSGDPIYLSADSHIKVSRFGSKNEFTD